MNLEEHKKRLSKNPLKTPEGYFESQKQDLLKKLSVTHQHPIKQQKPQRFFAGSILAVAAILLIVFTVWPPQNQESQTNSFTIEVSEIPTEYLDEDVIAVYYEAEALDLNSSRTIDYLIENEISLELIAENI